jgi:type IV secretory pathway VirB9-like protein
MKAMTTKQPWTQLCRAIGLAAIASAAPFWVQAQHVTMTPDICQQMAAKADQRSISARPSPLDNRLVVFPYSASGLYTIHTHHNLHTHIELDVGERLVASYLNDETLYEQKAVEATLRDLFIRPLVKGAVGGLTIITDKRRYQVELYDVSSCPRLTRYQRVSWQLPNGLWSAPGLSASAVDAAGQAAAGQSQHDIGGLPAALPGHGAQASASNSLAADHTDVRVAPSRVDVSRLNLEYEITGDAEIRPLRVFDDGTRTIIQFPDNMGLRPAIFVVNSEGQGEPVEYVPRGNSFELARTFDHGLLLKLGKLESRVRNVAKSRCSWFDKACKSVAITNVQGAQR